MGRLKLCIVGDGAVGKTCLLQVIKNKEFPEDYIPTVFDNFNIEYSLDGKKYDCGLWDTAGQEDYDRLRPLSYPGTSTFIICFSVMSIGSYENVQQKWYPEVHHHSGRSACILVGTKIDLREDKEYIQENEVEDVLTYKDGEILKNQINAAKYVECSAKTMEGVHNVFDEAIRAHVHKSTYKSGGGGSIKCLLL